MQLYFALLCLYFFSRPITIFALFRLLSPHSYLQLEHKCIMTYNLGFIDFCGCSFWHYVTAYTEVSDI